MNVAGLSIKKSRGESMFLVIASLSALLSVTVISAVPLYFDSIERLGLSRTLERFTPSQMGAWVHISDMTFNSATIKSTRTTAIQSGSHLGDVVQSTSTFVRSGNLNLSQINDRFAPPGSILVYQGVQSAAVPLSLVSGAFPSDANSEGQVEIALLEEVAVEYGISVGDVLKLTVPPTKIVHTTPRVTGIFRIDDPNHESWQGLSSTLFDPEQGPTGGRAAIIALTSNTMMDRVANRGIADIGQMWVMFYTEPDELSRVGASKYLTNIDQFRTEVAKSLPSSSSFVGLESALRRLKRQLTFTNTTTVISGALFAAFAIFVLTLNASVISRRWISEELALKVRGADRNQLLSAILFYASALFLIPAVVGPILASAIVPLLGLLGSFQALTSGRTFPYRILPEQFLWSAIVVLILLIIYLAPRAIARPGPIVRTFTRLRDSQSPWFWRANLDLGIVIAACAVIFELNGRGSLFVQRDDGLTGLSVLAASLPIVAAVAASLIALRLFRFTGVVFERLAQFNFHSMLALALKIFSRSTMRHAVLMLLAAGTMIVVINANGLSATLGKNTQDRIEFITASDMRISGIDAFNATANPVVSKISDIDWVSDFTWAARTEARTGGSESSTSFTMLSVKPDEFADVAQIRPDFADRSLSELMVEIARYSPTESLPLPDSTISLQASVRLKRASKGRIDIWARFIDGNRTTHTIRLTQDDGSQSGEFWHVVKGDIRQDLPRPLRLLAVEIYEPPTSPIGSAATLTIDSIHAVDDAGNATLISDFNEIANWHAMVTSLGEDTDIAVVNDGVDASMDGRALQISMGRGTDDGVRGVYYSSSGPITVPLLVNPELLEFASLSAGDQFVGQAYGRFVPFEIRGTFDLFPTMTDASQPFGVANVDALLSYLTPVSEPFLSNTAELFLTIDDLVPYEDRIAMVKDIEPALRVSDREALQAESFTRLGDAAGWRIVGVLISGSALMIALITVFAITIHHQDLTRLDAALVESLGGSRLGVTMESVTRIFVSMFIGYGLGVLGGVYGVRFIADRMTRTATGESALPPMLVQIDWVLVIAAAVLLAAVAIVPVVWSGLKPHDTVAGRIRASSVA